MQILQMQLKDGHSPIVLPLPSARLAIKADLTVFEHILSARRNYVLPAKYQELLNAITYADYIADIPFIGCISARIQIPRTKLCYSIPFEQLRTIVRNRFRQISNGKTLRPPPQYTECVKCGSEVQHSSETSLQCCLRLAHRECVEDDDSCPYCGTTWQLLNCCACDLSGREKPPYDIFQVWVYDDSVLWCPTPPRLHQCSRERSLSNLWYNPEPFGNSQM